MYKINKYANETRNNNIRDNKITFIYLISDWNECEDKKN